MGGISSTEFSMLLRCSHTTSTVVPSSPALGHLSPLQFEDNITLKKHVMRIGTKTVPIFYIVHRPALFLI